MAGRSRENRCRCHLLTTHVTLQLGSGEEGSNNRIGRALLCDSQVYIVRSSIVRYSLRYTVCSLKTCSFFSSGFFFLSFCCNVMVKIVVYLDVTRAVRVCSCAPCANVLVCLYACMLECSYARMLAKSGTTADRFNSIDEILLNVRHVAR